MKDFFPEKYFSIRDNYYLVNVYKHMIKSKFLHFYFFFYRNSFEYITRIKHFFKYE